MKYLKYILILMIIPHIAECGYHFGRGVGVIPKVVSKLYVPIFTNITNEVEIEDYFTEAMRKTIADSSDSELVSKQNAEAIVEGTITSYNSVPIFFSSTGTASVYQLTVVVNIKLVQTMTDKTLWEMNGFTESIDFNPVNDPLITKELEHNAVQSLAVSMTHRAFDAMHSNF